MEVTSRIVLATALLAGTVVGPALPASSLEPAWSVVSSVSPPGPANGTFGSVACATETTCFAAGNTIEGGVLFEQWNGTSWSIVPTPVTGVQLYDIACPSATSCFVVGFGRVANKDTPIIERWDGTTWSVAPNPEIAASAALESIACASPTSCVSRSGAGQNLIEQWDGATWTVAASPHPASARSSYFVGSACANATDCFAVGISYDGSYSHPLTEHWNGTAWSIVPSLDRTTNSQPNLNSVACLGAQSCFAVGSIETFPNQITKTLIERWNGTKWTVVASPNDAGAMGSSLTDVSCPTATSCFAVGNSDTSALIERWNGTTWSIVASASPNPNNTVLSGVSCTSPVSCVAVGSGPTVTGPAVIERWNGTRWALESHPMPMPPSSALGGVSCRGETCFAVGQYTNPKGVTVTLVERPDPSGWSVVPSPNAAGATDNGLGGVSCVSATFCVAVGSSSTASSATKTLIERWNGSKWSIVPSPNGAAGSALASVSCTSATNCFAVGSYQNSSSPKTLVERWNGSKWSIVPSPNRAPSAHVKTRSSRLASVSCATATSCFAVGSDADDTRGPFLLPTETLVERWNGAAWSIVKSPNPGQTLSVFHGVSCPGPNTCFAVGEFFTSPAGGGPSQSLIARWNGTAWTRVVNVGPAPASTSPLNSVSCSSPTSCVAVGNSYSSQWSTLVKTLAGASWSNVASPDAVDGSSSHLQAVSCVSAARCYAVGYSGDQTARQHTLVESYS